MSDIYERLAVLASSSRAHTQEMQKLLPQAPTYRADPADHPANHSSYEYGYWPADDDRGGFIIAQETVPPNAARDNWGNLDYDTNPSRTIKDYMLANTLVGILRTKELGAAIKSFGFSGQRYPTDEHGSGILWLELPTVNDYNTQLDRSGINSVSAVIADPNVSRQKVVEDYVRQGHIPAASERTMTISAPFWALLPNSVHNARRLKAAQVLHEGDPEEISIFAPSIAAGILGSLKQLNAALETVTRGRSFSDGVDVLGYRFNNEFRHDEEDLPDKGRVLAEQTVARIMALGALGTDRTYRQ